MASNGGRGNPIVLSSIPESCKRPICTSGTIKQIRTAKNVQEFVTDTYVRPSKRILFECALLVAISYWLTYQTDHRLYCTYQRRSPILMHTLTMTRARPAKNFASLIRNLDRPTFVKSSLIEEIMSKTYKIVVMGGDYSGPEVFFVL